MMRLDREVENIYTLIFTFSPEEELDYGQPQSYPAGTQ